MLLQGDLVILKNLHPSWGKIALITDIHITSCGTGQIHLIADGLQATIPWLKKDKYISRVADESR